MAARKPTALDASVREKLLASAIALFTTKGYAATTVREIVESAGVTKPVLYYYFRNKEGLFLELMRDGMLRFDAIVERAQQASGPARGRIEGLCLDAFHLFKQNIPVVRVLNSIYYGPPQGAPPIDIDQMHHRFQQQLKRLLVEGRKAGEFRFPKVEDAMWAVIGVLNIATEVELCHPEMALSPRDLRRVLGIVFAGIDAQPHGETLRAARKRKGVNP